MFYFYAKRGGLTPRQRAENVSHEITTLGKRFNLHPDSVYIESTDIVTDVMYGDKVIVSFTDQDGLWESCTRDQLAAAKRTVIVEKLKVMKEEHGLLQLFKRIAYFVLVLVGQFLLFKLTNWLFRKLKVRILRLRNTRLKAFSIQDFELLDTQKQVRLLVFVANLFRYAFMVAMIYPYLPGADSGVFQGISVFVGLIVSLGSSTVIGNIIAGLVITYMRPFKLGDRIQLNETTGNVVEKTPLVTRIRTPKNEVVTIPNSFIMSPHYMAMRDGNDPAMPKDDLSGRPKKK